MGGDHTQKVSFHPTTTPDIIFPLFKWPSFHSDPAFLLTAFSYEHVFLSLDAWSSLTDIWPGPHTASLEATAMQRILCGYAKSSNCTTRYVRLCNYQCSGVVHNGHCFPTLCLYKNDYVSSAFTINTGHLMSSTCSFHERGFSLHRTTAGFVLEPVLQISENQKGYFRRSIDI